MSNFKYAYAIWPWGTETKEQFIQAVKDIKEAGYIYFESVKDTINLFNDDPNEFKTIINEYDVKPVSFYFHITGTVGNDIDDFEKKALFMAENNVKRMNIQAICGRKDKEEELKYVLNVIEKVGKIAKEYNIIPCVHPHYNTSIQFEDEIDFIMQNTDPDYIAFGPDTAHLMAAGCDPIKIISRYADRIKFMHLKDFASNSTLEASGMSAGVEVYHNFVELGRGDVDFPAVMKILDQVNYNGYMCIELDESKLGNKESAIISLEYLNKIRK